MRQFLKPFFSNKASTEVFAFEFNDGGRQDAGFVGAAGDCVVRSIAIAANLPYKQVYEDLKFANAAYADSKNDRLAKRLTVKGSSPRNGNHRKVFHKYILNLGFKWVPTMAVGKGCQVHLRSNELPDGVLIVKVSKHLSAVVNGVIQDTHNPSRAGQRCVYGYYLKQ
uniref:hypothetical protein n=1 Tax=Polynucleobacter sp. TaxID=2029855 RepID=UPI00404806AC